MSRSSIDYVVQTASILGVVSVVAGADVHIYVENIDGSQGVSATVYASNNLSNSTVLSQPLVSASNGTLAGFLNPGNYLFIVTGAGFTPLTVSQTIGYGGTPPEIWAPSPSGSDDTSILNTVLAQGSVRFPAGTYIVDGIVTFPIQFNQIGAGTVFQLGVHGQIQIADPQSTEVLGGITSGIDINGNLVNHVATGGFFVNAGNNRTYTGIQVRSCVGDCAHIEQTQNNSFHDCVFQNSTSGTPLVFDHGTGGNRFWGGEIGEGTVYGSVLFQQTYADAVGYGLLLGPSDNKFYGTIMEYASTSSLAQVGHLAGTSNGFYGSSVAGYSTVGPVVLVKPGCQVVTTTATITAGLATITVVGSTVNIGYPMFANVPGFNADVQVISVAGQVVTLDGVAASSHGAGTVVGFGSYSTDVLFTDSYLIGSGSTPLLSTGGSATVSLSGKTTMQGGSYGFSMYASDAINISGPVLQQGVTHWAQQNPADTGTAHLSYQIGSTWNNQQSIITQNAPYTAIATARVGDSFNRFLVQDGAIFLGDGSTALGGVALSYAQDARDGLHLLESTGEFLATSLRVTGAAGATTQSRFLGIYNNSGAPTAGTWITGDFIIDVNGCTFVCTSGGIPGTWVGPNQKPVWTNLTPIAGLSDLAQPRYCIDSFGFVHLDGAMQATASIAASTPLFTSSLPVGFRPPTGAGQLFNVYEPSSIFTSVDTSGDISVGYAMSAGMYVSLSGLNFPTN
jgi:hypothetical protein